MKKILITGKNGYISRSLQGWLNKYRDSYAVDTINLRNLDWKATDFSSYDVIFHAAGISHSCKDESKKRLYQKINTQLTFDLAEKAKKEGVKQFIFMSSIIVYGDCVLNDNIITVNTIPEPNDIYGISKLNAEKELNTLKDEKFQVAIIRAPMIYGKFSKGNYPKLAKLAKISPYFPLIENKRSILHIDNLCEFIKRIIDLEKAGLFFPQNKEIISTSLLVKEISKIHRKNIKLTKSFNSIIFLIFKLNIIRKIFGNLAYEQSLSQYDFDYQIRSFEESIKLTEITK